MFSFSSYFNRQSLTLIGLIVILISIPLTAMLAQKAQELRGRAAEGYACNDDSGEFKYCMWFDAADGGSITAGKGVSVWVVGGQDDQSPRLEGTVNFTAASSSGPGSNCSKPDFKNCWKFVIPASQVTNQTYVETFKSEVSDQAGTTGRVASSFTPPSPTPSPTPIPPTATPAPAAGVDASSCGPFVIDGKQFGEPDFTIEVNKPHTVTIQMNNPEKTSQGYTTNFWDSKYGLVYTGDGENKVAVSPKDIPIPDNVKIAGGSHFLFTNISFTPKLIGSLNFFWQMRGPNNQRFGAQCETILSITAPGASPGPAEPGTCLAQPVSPPAQFSCVFSPTDLPSCLGWQERTGTGWASKPEFSCSTGKSCYYCSNISVVTPTPTTPPEQCQDFGGTCSPLDPSTDILTCQAAGGRFGCSKNTSCWTCTKRAPSVACTVNDCQPCAPGYSCLQRPGIPTKSCECQLPGISPTPTPPAGAPTISPIPPGSTVIPIQVALQEFVKAPQTREGKVPASSRRSRADTEVRLVPTTGTPFNTKVNLAWKDERVGPNLGFFEGNIIFAPNVLPAGTNSYNILVKEPNHLRKTIATAVSITSGGVNPTVDGRANPLTVGDADGDNSINGADFAMVVRCLAQNVQRNLTDCSNRDKDADFDGDGPVTIFDYNWLAENFGKTGEP